MLKLSLKSCLILALCCSFFMEVNGQEDQRNIYQYIMLTPDKTNLSKLSENLRKHNQKFHSEPPYQAHVLNITNGDDFGKIVWQMGPIKLSDLDNRPSDNAHDEDWFNNVMPYVTDMTHGEYWAFNPNNSNFEGMDMNEISHPLIAVRFLDVNRGMSYRVGDIHDRIKEAMAQIDGGQPYAIYTNLFQQGAAGRHIAWVWYFRNWEEFSNSPNFMEAYKKAHGENSWNAYLSDMEQVFSNSWDVIYHYNTHLSGR